MQNLISVQEAQTRILSTINAVSSEMELIENSLNRILADNIRSSMDIPSSDLSSMDGFAVRNTDIRNAGKETPVTLKVIDDIPAGKRSGKKIHPGQAARIMTGAELPIGGDTVIPFEQISGMDNLNDLNPPNHIVVNSEISIGANVRVRGEDINKETLLFSKNHKLRPQDIGILAMMGHQSVNVFSRPRIGIFSTGDELEVPGKALQPGKIYESNSFMLAALSEKFGAHPLRMGKASDDASEIKNVLDQFIEMKVDMILSSGGVSVGTHDVVRQVILEGGNVEFWKVNIKPGKPLLFGNYQGIPFFGLPGNPVSSYISFLVFTLPAIRKSLCLPPLEKNCIKAVLEHPVQSDGRESYLRVKLRKINGIYYANYSSHQGSANLLSLVQSDALLIIPSGVKSLSAGTDVDAWLIHD